MPVRKDRRGRWHVEVCVRRCRVHRVCPQGATKAQAQQLESSIRRDLFAAGSGTANRLISDALAHYLDHHLAHAKSYRFSLCHVYRLADWTDGKRLSEAPAVASQFTADARRDYAAATVNRSLAALRRACHIAYTLGWCTEPVHLKIKALPEHNARHVYLTREQIVHLISCCDDAQVRDAILILAYTGLRLGELLRLTQDNIGGGMIRLDATTKTGAPRSVPIVPGIRRALKRVPLTYSKRRIQAVFVRARRRAKLAHVHIHDLRHTTASLLVQKGVSLYTVGAILGHASTQTTARYSHLDDRAKRAAMRKIG